VAAKKQRLALARGLVAADQAATEILLLDEPTSSVDSKNELLIYTTIFKKYEGKTIMSAIHRLHLLTLFDTIYFFERGAVSASGSLEDLLQKSDEFRELWDRYHRTVALASELQALGVKEMPL